MTLRFSKDFWGPRRSTVERSSRADLAAAIRRYLAESQSAANEAAPARQPLPVQLSDDCSVYLPEGYEPNYPYPLIVWFHRGGADESELLEVMPQVSTQNCIGLALRGTQAVDGSHGYDWPAWDTSLGDVEECLLTTVRSLRREYHVHSERIFPAGFAEGGAFALRLLFNRPEWFGGAAALGFQVPPGKRKIFTRFRELSGKRLLLATGGRDRLAPAAGMLHLAHMLRPSGLDIETRVYDAGHELPSSALRRIDHWLMEGICAANRVA